MSEFVQKISNIGMKASQRECYSYTIRADRSGKMHIEMVIYIFLSWYIKRKGHLIPLIFLRQKDNHVKTLYMKFHCETLHNH